MYSGLYTFHLEVKTIEGKEKYNVINKNLQSFSFSLQNWYHMNELLLMWTSI